MATVIGDRTRSGHTGSRYVQEFAIPLRTSNRGARWTPRRRSSPTRFGRWVRCRDWINEPTQRLLQEHLTVSLGSRCRRDWNCGFHATTFATSRYTFISAKFI